MLLGKKLTDHISGNHCVVCKLSIKSDNRPWLLLTNVYDKQKITLWTVWNKINSKCALNGCLFSDFGADVLYFPTWKKNWFQTDVSTSANDEE